MSATSNIRLCTMAVAVISLFGCNKHGDQKTSDRMQVERTAEWYQAHPDDLKADEKRCAGDAATMSRAACQNVFSAENALSEKEMEDAAAHNNAAAAPPIHK